MPKNKKIEIEKFILCDMVRREDNGKLIIIGMYPGEKMNINQEFPYVHNNLSFLLFIRGEIHEGKLHFRIEDPHKKTILTSPPIPLGKGKSGVLNLGVSQVNLISPGTYKIIFNFPNDFETSLPFYVEQLTKFKKKTEKNKQAKIPKR